MCVHLLHFLPPLLQLHYGRFPRVIFQVPPLLLVVERVQHDVVTEVVDDRRPAREPVVKQLRLYGVGPRHARTFEQLLLLPLILDEAFKMRNGLLINMLAPGREAEEGVHRPLLAGLGIFAAHARRVERAVVAGGQGRVLERED